MKFRHTKGFTMIEMLVVLAVIGLLVSIIMPAIRKAKSKAADVSIQKNLNGIRTQAQIYFGANNRSYGTAGTSCTNGSSMFSDPVIARQIDSATSTSGQTGVCANSSMAWVISVPLPGGNSWCVDSNETGKYIIADTVSISCP